MKNFIKSLYYNEKIRFLFVGGLNTSLSYGIFFVLSYFGVWYILANTIGFAVSLVNSFFWNKFFVFKQPKSSLKEILKFLLVYGVQYLFGISFLFVCVDIFHFNVYLSGIGNIFFCTLISFIGHKYFTYKTK